VKQVQIIRDPMSTMPKFAFVEFYSLEHASYALQCSKDSKLELQGMKVAFARDSVMHQLILQVRKGKDSLHE
jgi:hypothetical protein